MTNHYDHAMRGGAVWNADVAEQTSFRLDQSLNYGGARVSFE